MTTSIPHTKFGLCNTNNIPQTSLFFCLCKDGQSPRVQNKSDTYFLIWDNTVLGDSQEQSDLGLHCLYMPFFQILVFEILGLLQYTTVLGRNSMGVVSTYAFTCSCAYICVCACGCKCGLYIAHAWIPCPFHDFIVHIWLLSLAFLFLLLLAGLWKFWNLYRSSRWRWRHQWAHFQKKKKYVYITCHEN